MSWKTTLFGLLTALGGAVVLGIKSGAITHLPSWVQGVAELLMVIGPAGVGVFARDNNKTSEDVNAGQRNGFPPAATLILALVATGAVIFFLTGCAFNRQFATSTSTNPSNGVVTVTVARSTTLATWDAKATIEKTRATAGKTSSVGAQGIDTEASSSNTLNVVDGIVGAAVRAAMTAPK